MSKKGHKDIPTSDRPVVLRPSNDGKHDSYSKHKIDTNKKIAGHRHRSG